MKKTISLFVFILIIGGCSGMSVKKRLDSTLFKYAGVIRWANYAAAMEFMSPDTEKKYLPSRLEIDRLQQFSVSSYIAAPIIPGADEYTIHQNVQIKFYNVHTKREKIIIDKQEWRYDEELKHWWLMTGLPKLVQ